MSNKVSSSKISSMSKTAKIVIAADSAQDVSEQLPQPAVASQPSACGDEISSVETLKSDGSDAMILNAAQDSVSNDVTAAVGDNVQVEDESVSDDGSDDVFEPAIVNNEQADEDPSQESQLSVLSSDSSDCTVLLNAMIEARTTCESYWWRNLAIPSAITGTNIGREHKRKITHSEHTKAFKRMKSIFVRLWLN